MQNSYICGFTKILLILVFATTTLFAQTSPSKPPPLIPAPGNIQLPDGFTHDRRRGIDSSVGAIVRSDGFTISYDIGRMAGNYADEYFPEHFENLRKQTHLNPEAIERQIQYLQGQIEWRRRQRVNGEDLMIVLLKDSKLIASFVNLNANFVAKADSGDKVADFFLVVLTYQPNSKSIPK